MDAGGCSSALQVSAGVSDTAGIIIISVQLLRCQYLYFSSKASQLCTAFHGRQAAIFFCY